MNHAIKCTLASLFTLPGIAFANANEEVSKCVSISENTARLACFDTAMKNLPEKTDTLSKPDSKQNDGTIGDWQVTTEIDPMTDKPKIFAGMAAIKGEGSFGKPVLLAVACVDKKTSVYIMWNTLLGISYSPTVTYRLDKGTPIKGTWALGNDSETTFYKGNSVQLLKQILEAKTFVASVDKYSGGSSTAIFNTTGSADGLKKIRETCSW